MIPAFLNPAAGSADAADRALRRAGCFDVRTVLPDRLADSVLQAIDEGATRVVVAGGDGTLSTAAAAVAGTPAELAVLPAGTLNHFAADHGIPQELDAACEVAAHGRVIETDVGWVNGRLFLSTSSVGAYASFVRARNRLEPRLGFWLASTVAFARALARLKAFPVQFESEVLEKPYVTPLVFIGIGERELKLPMLGRRRRNGRPGLHVLIVRGRTRARLLTLAFAAAARGTGAVSRTPHVDSFVVTRCGIEQRFSTVAVDGEVLTLESPLAYEFGPGALRLVVPR